MTQTQTQQLAPTTLSQLIREGTQLHPQGFGCYVQWNTEGVLCTCAMGAAYDALSLIDETVTVDLDLQLDMFNERLYAQTGLKYETLYQEKLSVPDALHSFYDGAYTRPSQDSIVNIIFQLNDKVRWSREQIADWLETQGY